MGQQNNPTSATVLLVESSAIIGLDLAEELERLGYAVGGPLACAAALEWLETGTPAMAVLDVDLQSGGCVDLARELRARGVPILVFSAHDQRHCLAEFQDLPWLSMPAPMNALGTALAALAAGQPLGGRRHTATQPGRMRDTGRGPLPRKDESAETPTGGASA